MLKPGPWDKGLPENQCIFIRGFRVVRILKIWPKLRGQAGPNPDIEDESEPDIVLEPIGASADTNYEDPLHVLLKYIAEVAPIVIWLLLMMTTWLVSAVILEPDVLMEHLRNSAPEIQKVQFDFLPTNASWSRAEEGITKIATLSKGAFSVPYVVEMGGGLFLHQIGLPMATTNESSASGSTRQRHRRAASVGDTRAHIPRRGPNRRECLRPPFKRSTGRRNYVENPMQRHEGAINASSSSATLAPVGLPRLQEGGGENSEIWERPLDFITRTTALSAASEPPTVFGGQARSSTRDRSNTIPVGASSVGSPRFAQPTRSPILAHPTYKLGPFSPRTLAVMEKVASDTNGLLQLAEDGTVSAGNLEGLVSRVIDRPADSSRDDRFGATFLTAYQLFSTTNTFLRF
ncbi:hypothetical protein BC826DRAFT_272716 [Russula brevipes]|nr:hypothetical protein BC826DRAFT_272716 [Russula brevipes]